MESFYTCDYKFQKQSKRVIDVLKYRIEMMCNKMEVS